MSIWPCLGGLNVNFNTKKSTTVNEEGSKVLKSVKVHVEKGTKKVEKNFKMSKQNIRVSRTTSNFKKSVFQKNGIFMKFL